MINHDRRGENDMLPGGHRKDDHLYLIRVDDTAGQPIAIIPVFGMHGTLNDADSPLASTDSIGGVERVLEERFDRKVVVMHVQSAGADTAPSGHGDLDCNVHPGAAGDPCLPLMKSEGDGRAGADILMAAWTAAGAQMTDTLALSMVTRSIELGPYTDQTYVVRGGALRYAPFDYNDTRRHIYTPPARCVADRRVQRGAWRRAVPEPDAMHPAAAIPGDESPAVRFVLRLDRRADPRADLQHRLRCRRHAPVCEETRTTISRCASATT